MEVARAQTLPIRGVRIVWVDVRRPNDVGKEHGTERRLAWISHESNLAGHHAQVNPAIVARRQPAMAIPEAIR
jgi:hypothetical protein